MMWRATLVTVTVAVASAAYCGPGVRGQWTGAHADLVFRPNPVCEIPTVRQLVTCIGERRVHLIGDTALMLPGQGIQSSFLGCSLGKGGWHALAEAGADAPRFCQSIHKFPELAKRVWAPRTLGDLSLTYEKVDYVESIRSTAWWKKYVVGPAALELVSAAAAAETSPPAPTPSPLPASGRRLRKGAAPPPPPEPVPTAVILSAYWWHAVHPRAARAPGSKVAAPEAVMAEYLAAVRALLVELVASPAYAAYWGGSVASEGGGAAGAPGGAGGRVFWRLALPTEKDFRVEPNTMLLLKQVQVGRLQAPLPSFAFPDRHPSPPSPALCRPSTLQCGPS